MNRSARIAYVFMLLFFLLFNGLQVYLILQRINGAKAKFNVACTEGLLNTLFQYNKRKAPLPSTRLQQALISWSQKDMQVNRTDSQHIQVTATSTRLYAMRVDPAAIEGLVNRPGPVSLDLHLLDSLYGRTLDSMKIHSSYRLDTFPLTIQPGTDRKEVPALLQAAMEQRRNKSYPFFTSPQRIFFYPGALLFAEHKTDFGFFKRELTQPLLAFLLILLMGNAALLFVYRTIRRQKKSNELKTDFINNMTHEMKTPITIASAGLEALEHQVPATERTDFYIRTSKKQLNLLNAFVERILEAAVQDMADYKFKKEAIDLQELLSELIQSHSLVQTKPVQFRLTGSASVFIHADRLHLETALHNIIDNAIKYSGSSVEIALELTENGREAILRIRDNGMGIPSQYIHHIYEKFFRVPQGDVQAVKGFGLGLYYVSQIIKKHGGTIAVQSAPEAGTTFIITLPKNA